MIPDGMKQTQLVAALALSVATTGSLADSSARHQHRLFSSAFGYPGINASYDYVVIGGGTAGLTLASRLATHASVAVVEAGGFYEVENGNNSVVPLLSLTGIAFIDPSETFTPQPLMDWGLVTQPITNAGGRRLHYAQGKTLSGSSAINTMSYIRATRGSYQRWADVVGDDSYQWDSMLEYFKRSVHLSPPDETKRSSSDAPVVYDPSAFDPKGGPLQVSWNNWVDPTLVWMAKAVEMAGLPLSSRGFESGELVGHGAWVPSTVEPTKARRSSSESSFLRDSIKNTNVVVYTHTRATKILFDSSSPPKATGARVDTGGLEYTISANKEVILSAGTFHSPQLLMVSGIGPRSILEAHAIPVVADVPGVGQNLWDPVQIFASYPVDTPSGQTLTANPALVQGYKDQYLEDASGPFSSAAGFLAAERIPPSYLSGLDNETRTKLDDYPTDWPELSYIVGTFVGPNLTTIGTTSVFLPLTFSRGNVSISSPNASDPPVIDLNWFGDPADMEIALVGLKRMRNDMWNTSAASAHKAGPELFPGDAVRTDDQLRDYIRQNANTIWHACSTCAMGKAEHVAHGRAVVDSRAKVFGVGGLRICDASVFPFALPAHPQAGVYALAEKIADDILSGR